MAGTQVSITVDDAEVQAALTRIAAFGATTMRETLVDVGESVLNSTRDRARREESPDGVRWVDLSKRYAARKAIKRPGRLKLQYDLHMLGDQFAYQVGDGYVDIGTNAPYGAIQQFGGRPGMAPGPAAIKAREWLGLSSQDQADVIDILSEHLQAAIDGR
ncbi:MAG TPA: phage virion morphogenesis protein [Rhodanobacteraceae bacterium]|nr:phage virion morphogenesis protein [Rhodanobacteraceae bacterium]